MKPILVTCAIITKGAKILAVQRSKTMTLPLKWEFPGGKIEHNESYENCIKREVKEELNIDIKPVARLMPHNHTYEHISIRLIPFLAEYTGGEIRLSEHHQYKWFSKDQLKNLDWAAADIPILNEFINL